MFAPTCTYSELVSVVFNASVNVKLIFLQEDPGGVPENVSVHLQQCVRLHQVNSITKFININLVDL